MAKDWDLIITGGRVITPSGLVEADVAVAGGRIVDIGKLDAAKADETFDARGLTVLPGVIDTQVHFREPGLEHKEDLESGTRAAVMGGVTAIFEMPNTSPATIDAAALNEKLSRAEGRAWCDHAFFIGAAAENADKLGELERLPGCCGVKIFMGSSTGSLLVYEDDHLRRVLKNLRRRCSVHSEDEVRLRERFDLVREGGKVSQHPEWRDVETAVRSTKRLLRLAREAGKRIHVLHVTTAEEVPILAAAKDIATMEVTPQHLTLAAPYCYEELGSFAQMNPPIREARHREALWEAVRLGIVDVIGSDHAPHTREEKQAPYPRSPSGMPGVQTLLPLLLDHMNAGRLSLERLVDLTSAGAQRIFNIAGKGRIAVGYDGDFTLVDLKAKKHIEPGWLQSKCGWSPFENKPITGWPMATVIRGHVAMRDGELLGGPTGRPVRFTETLPHEGAD
ncbi:MAG: dihydroorotase [Kiloniellaceae bacterium]